MQFSQGCLCRLTNNNSVVAHILYLSLLFGLVPITVVAGSKALTVFARSNTGIVVSNPTRGMDVCVRLVYVCVVLCVGSGLATG
jgi:hypothetical protein